MPAAQPATDGKAARYDPYLMRPEDVREPPVSLWAALKKIGPGIILAGSIVGSGELLLTTGLGAEYGYIFLWLILFSCVIKVFVQIELGRYAISSGKPTLGALNELPGPRWRVHWQVWWWLFMLLATVAQLGAMVGGVAQAMNLAFPRGSLALINAVAWVSTDVAAMLLSHPEYPWAVLTTLAAIGLLLAGGYNSLEKITTVLVAGVTSATVICVLVLPYQGYPIHWSDVQEGFRFHTLNNKAIIAAFGCFGITGVGASELYAYPYWCLEKGYARYVGRSSSDPAWAARARGWIRVMRLDAWVSMLVFTTATVAFYLLGATVLHAQQLKPEKHTMIANLAEMYVPAFGDWARVAFLIGAWAVLFKTLYVSSAGHSRLMADFLGLAGVVHYDSPRPRRRWIKAFCVFFPSLALLLYFVYRDPKAMVIFGGFAQAATLPIISGAALYLRFRRIDPRIRPSWFSDLWLWVAVVSITAVACYSLYAWGADLASLLGLTAGSG